jgi:hypothetical protein
MNAKCAWCGTDMGERPGPAGVVTHGICGPCADMMVRDMAPLSELGGVQVTAPDGPADGGRFF